MWVPGSLKVWQWILSQRVSVWYLVRSKYRFSASRFKTLPLSMTNLATWWTQCCPPLNTTGPHQSHEHPTTEGNRIQPMGTLTSEMDSMPLLMWAEARGVKQDNLEAPETNLPQDITGIMNSARATVHDELCPLSWLVVIGPHPVTFVSNF